MSGIVPPSNFPEELAPYVKLLKIGVPEGNVRKKIIADGFPEDTFDKYLNPETAIPIPTVEENEIAKADSFGDVGLNLLETMDMNGNGFLSPNGSDILPPLIEGENKKDETWKEEKAAELLGEIPVENNKQNNNINNSTEINFVPPPNQELKLDLLQPILVKKTLLIVNTFIVNTGAFLNQFVATCENKLHKIHAHVERMETTLGILEGKLQSIDWLQNAEQGIAPNLPTSNELGNVEFKDDIGGGPSSMGPNGIKTNTTTTTTTTTVSVSVTSSTIQQQQPPTIPSQPAQDPLKSDPDMQPWFKMLKVGVPAQAVRNKMSAAGVDASLIERVLQIHSTS